METTPEMASGLIRQLLSTRTPPAAANGSPAAKIQASTVRVKRELCNRAAVSFWSRPSAISTTIQAAFWEAA